jgi:hypothetical protein
MGSRAFDKIFLTARMSAWDHFRHFGAVLGKSA